MTVWMLLWTYTSPPKWPHMPFKQHNKFRVVWKLFILLPGKYLIFWQGWKSITQHTLILTSTLYMVFLQQHTQYSIIVTRDMLRTDWTEIYTIKMQYHKSNYVLNFLHGHAAVLKRCLSGDPTWSFVRRETLDNIFTKELSYNNGYSTNCCRIAFKTENSSLVNRLI